MKGSVIGNSQAKICRSELTRRELGFRFGSDVISDPSNAKPSSSDQAPFLKPTPHSRSVKNRSLLYPMGLLLQHEIFITKGEYVIFIYICNFKHVFCFSSGGVFEKEAAGKYEWSVGYLAVAEIVKKSACRLELMMFLFLMGRLLWRFLRELQVCFLRLTWTNLSGGNPLWGLGGPHDAPASLIPLLSSQTVDLLLVSSHLPCRPCPLRCFISIQRKWYDAFTVFVRNMNQVELSSYDQAVEDEAQTVSLGSGTGAHSLQTA
ncbi:unnamed protein product [Brassica oleracea]